MGVMRKVCNMNRFFLLLTFILSIGRTFGQTDEELAIQHAIQARTTTEIENFKGKFRFVNEHWDLLNSGLVQSNYQLAKKKKFERIGLLTLSLNSEIVYSEVYKWDLNERYFDDEENEPFWNYQIINSSADDQFSELNVNLEHLTKLPFRSTFGLACGAGAGMPDEGQLMLKLVKQKNTQELLNWLNSINPVRQGFACLGLSLLAAQGTELESSTTDKINQIKTSNFLVYTCIGCTVWEPIPFSELLTEEQIQRFIEEKME
jgi:hypothetical protein